jgi:hypothetical protein
MLAEWPVTESESPVDEQTHVHDVLEVELALTVAEKSREEIVETAIERDVPAEPPIPAKVEPAPVPPRSTPARTARHRIDPLDEPAPRARRFGRRQDADVAYAEVPARPERSRSLPSRPKGDS